MTSALVRDMASLHIADRPGVSNSPSVAPRAVYGRQVTVQYMTDEQKRDLQILIDKRCLAEQNLADARREIAGAEAGIVAAKAREEAGRAQKEAGKAQKEAGREQKEAGRAEKEAGKAICAQAQTKMTACDAKIVQGLDTFAAQLLKKKEAQKDQQAATRIEALRQKVLNSKTNLPKTSELQQQMLLQLQKEAQALYQSLKTS